MYQISWLVKGRVVYIAASGVITDGEIAGLDKEMVRCLEQRTVPLVHFIFAISQLDGLPSLKGLNAMTAGKHPAMGWNLVAGNISPIATFLVTIVSRVNRARLRIVDSPEAALAFLKMVDSTLPDMNAHTSAT